MGFASLELAEQRDHAPAFGVCQCANSLPLLGRPFHRSTGMASLVHPGQAKLLPALPPLLDAIQASSELTCRFLQL
jgi:hypothetical protein